MTTPVNHNTSWTERDLYAIEKVAAVIEDKREMEAKKTAIAEAFGRTESSVCSKIEEVKG